MLNWSIRYSKVLIDNPGLFDVNNTVAEIGCGAFGIAHFLRRPVIGVEPEETVAQTEYLTVQRGSITDLPFPDDSIDYVICMDVMEHLPRVIRARAIRELVRVCKRKVIISCPCHQWAKSAEGDLKSFFERFGVPVPAWLLEHLDLGLPSIPELLQPIVETGLRFQIEGNETILQHYSGIALDWLFPEMGKYGQVIKERAISEAPIHGSKWDVFYSFVFSVLKSETSKHDSGLDQRRVTFLDEATDRFDRAAIYAVCHKDMPGIHLGSVIPVLAGPAAARAPAGSLTDRLTNGVSLVNHRWSELSAIYRVWREGPRTGVVGFTHYRRQFDFRGFDAGVTTRSMADRETLLAPEQVDEFSKYFSSEAALRAVERGALIVAKPHDTVATIFDHYCNYHNTADYLDIFNRMSETQLLGGFVDQLRSNHLFANNMFMASWPLFSELCVFWFSCLGAFEVGHPETSATSYQKRDIAFLSERIFDAWVRYRKSVGTEVIEVPIFFIQS